MTRDSETTCPICGAVGSPLRIVDEVTFFRCAGCGSLYAHPDFLAAVDRGATVNYGDAYWAEELGAARERSHGGSIARVAEVVRMSRIPLRRLLDVGSGPGTLLDALATLLPSFAEMVHGIELSPPPLADRSRHPNYHIGSVGDLQGFFDGGVCIEVIEHLTPTQFAGLARELASRSTPGALYFFNSAQPSFVESTDPGYLDPRRRGHVVSWSIAGAAAMLAPAGFNVIPLPGRDWAFLAEFGPPRQLSADDLLNWLWRPVPENLALTRHDPYGPLFATIGLESARCYLESALATGRGHWALELERQVRTAGAAIRSAVPARSWLRRWRGGGSG